MKTKEKLEVETKHIVDYRSHHDILIKPMTVEQLESNKTTTNRIKAKLLFDFNDLVNNDLEWFNDEVSERITRSIGGLVDIIYSVAGRTTSNEVIIKVDGEIDFENI